MKKVLILDNAISHEIYRPVEHWARYLDCPFDVHSPPRDKGTPQLEGYSHMIVTGSEASITERTDWSVGLEEIVRSAAKAGLAILGSCYGHQMVALALGGAECVRRTATPEFGWKRIEVVSCTGVSMGLGTEVYSFCSHFDEVCNLPRGWKVLAGSEGCDVQILQAGYAPIWGIQAHPEINPEEGRRLLEDFARLLPDKEHLFRPAIASEARDSRAIHRIVKNFLSPKTKYG